MTFTVKLGIAYYYKGFINIKKRYSDYFGDHEAPIEVHLGRWGNRNTFYSVVNRTINPNHMPRIYMSTPYITWVQAKYRLGDELIIEILNPEYPNAMLIR
jgi:hypothetical protein